MDCFLCRKHNGEEPAPPGGYIYEDEQWMVCHAPARLGPLGTLFIESRRHFLDYAEMSDAESASLGHVMRKVYETLKLQTGAERIYQITLMEGVPHFHSWLVPHHEEDPEKGMKFLARDDFHAVKKTQAHWQTSCVRQCGKTNRWCDDFSRPTGSATDPQGAPQSLYYNRMFAIIVCLP